MDHRLLRLVNFGWSPWRLLLFQLRKNRDSDENMSQSSRERWNLIYEPISNNWNKWIYSNWNGMARLKMAQCSHIALYGPFSNSCFGLLLQYVVTFKVYHTQSTNVQNMKHDKKTTQYTRESIDWIHVDHFNQVSTHGFAQFAALPTLWSSQAHILKSKQYAREQIDLQGPETKRAKRNDWTTKTPSYLPWNNGCLIGTLIMFFYNPHITV